MFFRRHGESVSAGPCRAFSGRVERRVMGAITACRTALLGGHVEQCDDCGATRIALQTPAATAIAQNWPGAGARRMARASDRPKLLPVPYFHVVFTLAEAGGPDRLPEQGPPSMGSCFRAAAETLTTMPPIPGIWARNRASPRCSIPGVRPCSTIRTFIAWCQAAAPRSTATRWIACRPDFFLPVRVLSRLFRRLFLQNLQDAFDAGKDPLLRANLRRSCRATTFATGLDQLRRSNGSSMPSRHSVAPNRCWPISAAIPIASPSPTVGWSRSLTASPLRWKDYRQDSRPR